MMLSSSPKSLSTFVEYAADIRRSAPRLSVVTLVLLLAASLFEGVGYILLLPILGYLGLNSSGGNEAPESFNPIIDPILNALSPHLSLGLLLLLFFGVLALRAMLTYFATSSTASLKGKFLHHHRASLHHALVTSSWAFLSIKRRSRLTHALTTQSNIIVNGVDTLYRGAATVLTMGVAVVIAAILSWKITLGVLGLSLIILWPLKYFNRRAFQLGDQARHDMVSLFEHSIRYFKGLKSIKASSAEGDVVSFFEDQSHAQAEVFSVLERNHARASLVYQIVSAIFLVSFVYLALTYFPDQKAQIIVLIIIFARLAPRANALQSYANHIAAIFPEYLAAKDLRRDAIAASDPRDELISSPNIKEALSFSNLDFSYGGNTEAPAVLTNLNLSFPVKSSTAIVGPSGAGKTTLADIIAGLLSPTVGEVKVDEKILTEAERRGLEQSIQYVTDEDFLFDDSVRKNLLLGHKDAADNDIWKALEKANADAFVRDLIQGLDTQIGDSGTRLSHGQRQRLSLARGLLGKPQILILDEPTSALSQQDLKQIIDTLKALSQEMIIIIITHDEPSFQWADQMIRVD